MNNLPPEVLTIILNYLDIKSMISSSLVSRLWNRIISNSKIFLNRAIYVMKASENYSLKFKRKYQRIRIVTTSPFYDRLNQQDNVILFMNQLHSDVKSLMIHGIDLGDSQHRLDLKFKWKELELFGIKSMYSGNWSNVIQSAGKNSSVYFGYECYERFMQAFLNEVRDYGFTKTLKIQLHALNLLDSHFYEGLNNLNQFESLEIRDDLLHLRRPCAEIDSRVANLSYKLINIQSLRLDYRSTFYFQINYDYAFNKVKYLVVEKITEHLPQLDLPSLKILEIENCKLNDIKHLQYFCRRLNLNRIKINITNEDFKIDDKTQVFNELYNIMPHSTELFEIVDGTGRSHINVKM